MSEEETATEYIKKLQDIADNERGLRSAVAQILVDNADDDDDDLISYMEDVLNHGCVSGIVGDLIYYTDTIKFFDDNEEDIEDLIDEMKAEFGYKTRPQFIDSLNGSAEDIDQEKNLLAWFAFEETTRVLMQDIKGEW